ncbi:MAG TPA: NADH-quinone oxidoreductase subunit C [Jiangellaceae bacterium]|nr:NADH-quinone oxidoreductase subunit C [Jiangellaceae bacterium]
MSNEESARGDRSPEKDEATAAAAGTEEPAAAPDAEELPEQPTEESGAGDRVGAEKTTSAEAVVAGPGDLPAEAPEEEEAGPPPAHPSRRGMFGVTDTGDTSGYGRLVARDTSPIRYGSTPRPWGDEFDAVGDALDTALPSFGAAVERVLVDRGELTLFVRREHLVAVARALRDDPALRYEMCLGVSGVHYPEETGRELHAVYPFLSITHNRRLRVEVACPDEDPHIPSIVDLYPGNNWHERETYDFFGIIFDGHPALTRIEMPDDWVGHPQRKDYPLGGIPVEYKGATIPPPDERRAYN